MKIVKIFLITGFLFFISLSTSCVYNNEEELYPNVNCDTAIMSYSLNVSEILTRNQCIACHQTNSQSGGVNLDNYTDVKTYVDNGRLSGSINHQNGFKPMPQGQTSKIPQCDLDQIESWIIAGAKNN
jgi:hypothetical protein